MSRASESFYIRSCIDHTDEKAELEKTGALWQLPEGDRGEGAGFLCERGLPRVDFDASSLYEEEVKAG